jgi:hypothetical protein
MEDTYVKRKIALVTMAFMLVTFSILPLSALAEMHHFDIYNVQCYDQYGPESYYLTEIWKYITSDSFKVQHTATGSSNSYTNLFHATRSTSVNQSGILSGQKWCAPGSASSYIISNALYQNYYYGLAARGNTKYNQYEGLTSFTLTGGYDPN